MDEKYAPWLSITNEIRTFHSGPKRKGREPRSNGISQPFATLAELAGFSGDWERSVRSSFNSEQPVKD